MGKGIIQSHIGSGKYTVEVQYDRSGVDEQIAKLESVIEKLDEKIDDPDIPEQKKRYLKAARASAQKRIDFLEGYRVPQNDTIEAWCADLTTDLSGEIGLIEIARDRSKGINIQPGYEGGADYDSARDGSLVPAMGMPPAMAYVNLGLLPGAQKWLPTYRYAKIDSIDRSNDKCDVTFLTKQSGQQDLTINETSQLKGVPVEYMFCDSAAFSTGDEVIVKFEEYDFDKPKVIGFKKRPKPCDIKFALVISTPSGNEAFAWDTREDSLIVPVSDFDSVLDELSEIGYKRQAEKLSPTESKEEPYEIEDAYKWNAVPGLLNMPEDFPWHDWEWWDYYGQEGGSYRTHPYFYKTVDYWDGEYKWHVICRHSAVEDPDTGQRRGAYLMKYEGAPDDYLLDHFFCLHGLFDAEAPDDESEWRGSHIDPSEGLSLFTRYLFYHRERLPGWDGYLANGSDLEECREFHDLYRFWELWQNQGIASNKMTRACFEQLGYCADFRDPSWEPDDCDNWNGQYDLPEEDRQCITDDSDKWPRQYRRDLRIYVKAREDGLSAIEQQALELIKHERDQRDLPEVCWNSRLQIIARRHADDLARNLMDPSHYGSDGNSFLDRIENIGWREACVNGPYDPDMEPFEGREIECVAASEGDGKWLAECEDDPSKLPDHLDEGHFLETIAQKEYDSRGHAEEAVVQWMASKIGQEGEIAESGEPTHRDGLIVDYGEDAEDPELDYSMQCAIAASQGSDGVYRWVWVTAFRPHLWPGYGPVKTGGIVDYANENLSFDDPQDTTRMLDFYLV